MKKVVVGIAVTVFAVVSLLTTRYGQELTGIKIDGLVSLGNLFTTSGTNGYLKICKVAGSEDIKK